LSHSASPGHLFLLVYSKYYGIFSMDVRDVFSVCYFEQLYYEHSFFFFFETGF
jgi:hypothetical protein